MSLRLLALLALACGPLVAQGCGGVLANACAVARTVVAGTGAPTPAATFTTCPGGDSFSQGITLFDIPAGSGVRITLTAMTADFDLYVHLPPGACVTDLASSAYRQADSGGLPGTADECEVLTAAELGAYGCGWLAVVATCKDPAGGTAILTTSCVPAGATCAPAPTCTLSASPTGTRDVPLTLSSASSSAGTIDVTFEFSTDGGATWALATAAPGSSLSNPDTGVPVGIATFLWDTLADGLGTTAPMAAIGRATIDDGTAAGVCTSSTILIDNTLQCPTFCGDCNVDGQGPSILDALIAAQISAGTFIGSPSQALCCDVDSSGSVDILDALRLAQFSAGFGIVLACP